MNFKEELVELFGQSDLYKILAVNKTCQCDEIKSAYRKLALKVHPDRVKDKDKTIPNRKFQALSRISGILLNEEKRKIYDDTGILEECDVDNINDWKQFWNEVFPKFGMNDLDDYKNKYQNSEEEVNDIKNSYVKHKGNLLTVVDDIIFADIFDIDRIRHVIETLIDRGDVKVYRNFKKDITKAVKRGKLKCKREAKKVEKNKENHLVETIRSRKNTRKCQFDQMIDNLSAKYIKKKK